MLIKLDHKNKCPPVLNETQIHLDGATVWYVKSQLVELVSSINSFELQTQLHNNRLISAEQVFSGYSTASQNIPLSFVMWYDWKHWEEMTLNLPWQ